MRGKSLATACAKNPEFRSTLKIRLKKPKQILVLILQTLQTDGYDTPGAMKATSPIVESCKHRNDSGNYIHYTTGPTHNYSK